MNPSPRTSSTSLLRPRLRRPALTRLPGLAALVRLMGLSAVSMLLAGCGPGVGGTGTGATVGPAQFGAEAEPLCDADVAPVLACTGSPGSAPVLLADGDPARRASGRIDEQSIELHLACEGWRFEGTWGRAAAPLGARFYGRATNAAGDAVPATLTMRAFGRELVVQLHDELDVPMSPPLALRPMPAPVTLAPQCP